MTEYLYDKDNPKSLLRQRITGIQGLFYGAPNIYERAEMIYRTIHKNVDGDLSKFMTGEKPRDFAQKRRLLKAVCRFYKNPLGYLYWKTAPWFKHNKLRMGWICVIYSCGYSLLETAYIKTKKDEMMDAWFTTTGMSNNIIDGPKRLSHPRPMMHDDYYNFNNFVKFKRPKSATKIWMNWWCRDQNFRKYFQTRKAHGIKPSDKDFYSDKIYKEAKAKSKKLIKMRDSAKYNKAPVPNMLD